MVTLSAIVFARVPRALLVQTGSLNQTCGEREYCRQPGTRQGPTWEAMLGRGRMQRWTGLGLSALPTEYGKAFKLKPSL